MSESTPQPNGRPNDAPAGRTPASTPPPATPAPALPSAAAFRAAQPVVAAAYQPVDSMRETIESIAVAFILAFLFRTFVAEAFVIPTGSMATTLMGRHKDLVCPNCQYAFQASASAECDSDGNPQPNTHVQHVTCLNCGMTFETSDTIEYPSYRGDRIVVSKLDAADPQRWDVTVFRYPVRAGTNYIKRLVGLPGEEILIRNGDLFARPVDEPEREFSMLRKPPRVVRAMLRNVYDNDHVADWMTKIGWPPRWQPSAVDLAARTTVDASNAPAPPRWPPETGPPPGHWTTADGYRSFETDGSAASDVWLRYHHYRPGVKHWTGDLLHGAPPEVVDRYYLAGSGPWRELRGNSLAGPPAEKPLPPTLHTVSDFAEYNSSSITHSAARDDHRWVGDLAVQCRVAATGKSGLVTFELVEGGRRFQCRLDLASGDVQLAALGERVQFVSADGQALPAGPAAKGVLAGRSEFEVLFANVDNQLHLWIDGSLVDWDAPALHDLDLRQNDEKSADYFPVGVAARGVAVRVSQLRVLRDVYYTSIDEIQGERFPLKKFAERPELDQFFVLGDNSPQSQDARMWGPESLTPEMAILKESHHYVERNLIIGKALYIFWPHSWDTPVPFTPNFRRMQFIR